MKTIFGSIIGLATVSAGCSLNAAQPQDTPSHSAIFPKNDRNFYDMQEIWFDQSNRDDALILMRAPHNALILRGKSCESVTKGAREIARWSGASTALVDKTVSNTRVFDGKLQCGINVEAILPERARQLLWQGQMDEGESYNCYGAASYVAGLNSERQTSDKLYNYYLTSPACRPLADGEKPQPGDLIAISSWETSSWDWETGREIPLASPQISLPSHGAVYVSDRLIFNKDGNEGWVLLQDADQQFGRFLPGSPRECVRTSFASPTTAETTRCGNAFVHYYRCQTPEILAANRERFLSSKDRKMLASLDRILDGIAHDRISNGTWEPTWPTFADDPELYEEFGMSQNDLASLAGDSFFVASVSTVPLPKLSAEEARLVAGLDESAMLARAKKLVEWTRNLHTSLQENPDNENLQWQFFFAYSTYLRALERGGLIDSPLQEIDPVNDWRKLWSTRVR